VPVEKSTELCVATIGIFGRTNMVYAGTAMLSGQATVLVTALGLQTEFGKIGTLTTSVVDQQTPLEGEMNHVSRFLTYVILILATVVFIAALLRGDSIILACSLAAALAIAAIPEGLPMTLTVLLSTAMRRMFKRGVLVRHLNATETLGCVNVLCVDKTGTMTTGVMSVMEVRAPLTVVSDEQLLQHELFRALGCFANVHAQTGEAAFAGAATAAAVMQFVRGLEQAHSLKTSSIEKGKADVVSTIPFDPIYRLSACLLPGIDRTAYVMGAPNVLLERCTTSEEERASMAKTIDEMAARGLRVVMISATALGVRPLSVDAIVDGRVLGLLGIEDPLRESVPGAILHAGNAGIRTIMMTGDHPETARHIAAEAFGSTSISVMLGADFAEQSESDRLRSVLTTNVFARMLPEHKLLVVAALHANALRVAMTGDGVNDAPALKAADVGIAVGHATEVAKESSDIVLLDGDFGSITAAIAEGRTVFTNARNVTVFMLALGLGETMGVLGAFLFHMPPFLSPLLILWLNVVTDGIPPFFFAFEGEDKGTMQELPRSQRDGLVSKDVRTFLALSTTILALVLCGLLYFYQALGEDSSTILTTGYLFIGLLGVLFLFVTRSLRKSFFTNVFSKTPLWFGALLGLTFLSLPLFVPLLRSFFGLVPLSSSIVITVLIAICCVLVPLDFAKRKLVHRTPAVDLIS